MVYMATQAVLAKVFDDPLLGTPQNVVQDALQKQASELRYVARQPILDAHSRVHGYELLFWNGRDPAFRAETDLASRTMLDNAVLFGVDKLTCGLPAFVECTVDSLTENWVRVMPPNMTVVELLEGLEPTPDLLATCSKLKASGFRLALDDFTGKPESQPLVDLADYIKVDVVQHNAKQRRDMLRRLNGSSARLVAQHVETQEEYKQAREEGFHLFQGYYFCHPEPLKNHKIPANRLVHLEIMEVLQKHPIDLPRMSQLVMCDASLTFRLLRLVNSPICAMRQEVTSIQSALMLLGEETSRRVAMLAIASDFNTDQPAEILRMAFTRARFCELAAGLCGLIPDEQYLIGIISLFPAMLRLLMEDLIRLLPLREQARDALLGKGNPEGILLSWLMCHEAGDWAGCDEFVRAIGVRRDQVTQCHTEAVAWANAALSTAL
jgi:EAL and modified HD-GYP domain-containing signal transduction protein